MTVSLDLVADGSLKRNMSACWSAEFKKDFCHGNYQIPACVSFLFVEKNLWGIYELTFVLPRQSRNYGFADRTFLLQKNVDLHGLC